MLHWNAWRLRMTNSSVNLLQWKRPRLTRYSWLHVVCILKLLILISTFSCILQNLMINNSPAVAIRLLNVVCFPFSSKVKNSTILQMEINARFNYGLAYIAYTSISLNKLVQNYFTCVSMTSGYGWIKWLIVKMCCTSRHKLTNH